MKNKGFSLVEILISLLILGLGLLVLFNLFPLGLQSLNYGRKLNEVSFLAQKKIEELKSQSAIEIGQKSGKEGDLSWSISTQPLKLKDDIEVIYVEMDISFAFQGVNQKQRFVTYLIGS